MNKKALKRHKHSENPLMFPIPTQTCCQPFMLTGVNMKICDLHVNNDIIVCFLLQSLCKIFYYKTLHRSFNHSGTFCLQLGNKLCLHAGVESFHQSLPLQLLNMEHFLVFAEQNNTLMLCEVKGHIQNKDKEVFMKGFHFSLGCFLFPPTSESFSEQESFNEKIIIKPDSLKLQRKS